MLTLRIVKDRTNDSLTNPQQYTIQVRTLFSFQVSNKNGINYLYRNVGTWNNLMNPRHCHCFLGVSEKSNCKELCQLRMEMLLILIAKFK